MSKDKLCYINYFRAFAILMIVAGHSLLWGKHSGVVFGLNNYLFTGGTFLFLFIAGFLFQYLLYKFDYKTYLKKKLINVIIPTWFVIAPAAITLAFTLDDPCNYLYNKAFWVKLLNPFIWGHLALVPLWFISMITVVFILAPVLIKLFKHKVIWNVLLISGLVYSCMCYRHSIGFNPSLQANMDVSILQWNIKWLLQNFRLVMYFIPGYMLGMSVCDIIEKYPKLIQENAKKLWQIFSLSWVCCYFILTLVLKLDVEHSNISRIVLIFAVLFFFIHFENYIKSKQWLHKSLNFLAEYSFGIFFVHYYFLNILFRHHLYTVWNHVWYQNYGHDTLRCMFHAFGNFSLTLFGSILILFLLKNILKKLGVKNTRTFIGV